MIKLQNVTIGYGKKAIISNINLELAQGQLYALMGNNGMGKTTLLRALSGEDTLLDGNIIFSKEKQLIAINKQDVNNQNITKDKIKETNIEPISIKDMKQEEIAKTISIVDTERVRIPGLKCKDLVGLGRAPYTDWIGALEQEDIAMVDKALEAVGMQDFADRTMDKMSDGECQKIMIARALAQDTPIMLLDEPTVFLDIPGKNQIMSILRSLAHPSTKEKGRTIIVSTHDLDTARRYADAYIIINEDKQVLLQPNYQ